MAPTKRARTSSRASSSQSQQHQKQPLAYLPEDVLENVFTFLPIKKAIEVSTVSKKYQKTWLRNRKFLFGREFSLMFTRQEMVELVNRLFDSHQGEQIQTFHLHIDPIGVEETINKWLNISIEKGLEELDLYFFQPGCTLGVNFVNSLKTLRTLKLVYCEIELPPALNGLRFLNTLVLWHTYFTEEKLETLLKHCNLLSSLDMFHVSGLSHAHFSAMHLKQFKDLKIAYCSDLEVVVIESSTIRSLFFCGPITGIRLLHTVKLRDTVFNFEPSGNRSYLRSTSVEFLVKDLQFHVSVLTTSALFPEALTAKFRRGVFGEAVYTFICLTEIQLFMEGGLFCNPYDIFLLMKHCPVLERLFIDMNDYNFECGTYWELHQKPEIEKVEDKFGWLRIVKLQGFKFLASELELVKIILQKAINLESLILVTPRNGRNKLCKQDASQYEHLFLNWQTSQKAQILLYDHCNNDHNAVRPFHSKFWY
ncbi:hypothetical protein RJT34_13589 [Clitoria ternatea]|uniref:F-box domain-containing protein n=1 Tax=Clitoria ternatea TaxID=43366 RepID=A0AAN9JP88_CLITE